MKKILIGNDIKAVVSLSEYIKDFSITSIKYIQCYFIRDIDEAEFKRNKFPQFYTPDQYNMSICGHCNYNALPANMNFFWDPKAPHWFYGYCGFGVNSKPFKPLPRHYMAPVKFNEHPGEIECYFPAREQKITGKFKLFVVASYYESGWGFDNVKTTTIDCGNVFELVHSDADIDHDTTIYVNGGINIEYDLGDHLFIVDKPTSIRKGDTLDLQIVTENGYHIKEVVITVGDQTIVQYDDNIHIENVTEDVKISAVGSDAKQISIKTVDFPVQVGLIDNREKVDYTGEEGSYYKNTFYILDEYKDTYYISSAMMKYYGTNHVVYTDNGEFLTEVELSIPIYQSYQDSLTLEVQLREKTDGYFVGSLDNSSNYLSASSETLKIVNGTSVTYTFLNYMPKTQVYFSWLACIGEQNNLAVSSVLRNDRYDAINGAIGIESNIPVGGSTYYNISNNQRWTVTFTRNQDTMSIEAKQGDYYIRKQNIAIVDPTKDVYVAMSVDHSHMYIENVSTAIIDPNIIL